MQTFLREEGNVQKKLRTLPTISDSALVRKYLEIFPNLINVFLLLYLNYFSNKFPAKKQRRFLDFKNF